MAKGCACVCACWCVRVCTRRGVGECVCRCVSRNIECVHRISTHSTTEVRHLNYWERRSHLKLYSLERRRERYMMVCVWKMITGLVPNIGITTKHHQRHGRSCEIRKIAKESTAETKTICSASLKVRGCSLTEGEGM